MSTIARYTEADEWLEEVTANAAHCQWGVVRITALSTFEFQCETIHLIAGAVINGTLVELRHKVGTVVVDAKRASFIERYTMIRDRIRRAAEAVGLTVRAGWWIEVSGVPSKL